MSTFDGDLTDRFCCFFCPQAGHEVHALRDLCATCGNTYGFPLEQVPTAIRDYRNLVPLSRGFYSAVYVAERGALRTKAVLKIAPKAIYDAFPHKNFEEECRTHDRVAADSEHIVPIRDYFDADVTFGTAVLPCWVAALDYVDGPLLENVISRRDKIKGVTAAQIAIDLFRILKELDNKGVAHNDLHARNLVVHELRAGAKRAEAVDESIRVIALDLGSVAGETRSNATRLNDVHWVARHLHRLVESLLNEPERSVDLDFRLAAALQERAFSLSPDVLKSRAPSWDECIDDVWQATRRVSKPWQERLKLHHFGDSYNALTLAPWFVPLLLVDTDERWRSRVSTPGPQLITGMRGCGKTMLLRAVQFHARAAERKNDQPADAIARSRQDGFVGLYVSALRLLENPVVGEAPVEPFARLYVAYALEAVRTIFHLLDLEERASGAETYVDRRYHRLLGEAVDAFIGEAGLSTVSSGFELERQLIRLSAQLTRIIHECDLKPPKGGFCVCGAKLRGRQLWKTRDTGRSNWRPAHERVQYSAVWRHVLFIAPGKRLSGRGAGYRNSGTRRGHSEAEG